MLDDRTGNIGQRMAREERPAPAESSPIGVAANG
jgi:hypothetical protein